ncbi:MAG: ATP-binding protein [Candidatus Diapherotrites archaeon]
MKFKESEALELKKSTSELKEAVISITAILNKRQKGGLYFGIKNNGTIIGQTVTENTIREISKTISDYIEPKIYPKIKEIIIEEKTCVFVEFSGNETPYFAYGRSYLRVGDENKQVNRAELKRMLLEKSNSMQWDREICKDASIKDINAQKIKAFLKKAGLKFTSTASALKNLDLEKNGKPLNAAIVFFAFHPEKFFPYAKLRCAYFPTENTATIIDQQEHEGNILYLIEKAQEYILKNIHIGMRLEGFYRVDVPEINKEALREAVINAFCHRDYNEYDSIDLAVFKDRVEIRSPGLLYGGLTIQKIKTRFISERRNKLIAELFHRIHYIEKWGRGIKLILSKEPETIFKETGKHFIVIFPRKASQQTAYKAGLAEKLAEGLAESQKQILALMEQKPRISKKELSKKIGISTTAIDKNIQTLKKKKLIKRIGPDKGGYWKIIKKE